MRKPNRRTFMRDSALGLAAWAAPHVGLGANERSTTPRPNILWVTCEDTSPRLGCYGDRQAITPNLDRLAREGVRYRRAFASASVCTPARSTLITGVYASSLGTQHLRGPVPLPNAVRCFTEYLREAGYYCSNNVKEDYNFKTPKSAWDESSRKAHWQRRAAGQPFFSVFNFTTTHQGQVRYPREKFDQISAQLPPGERHDPAKITLPPYYPDTPAVRLNVAAMYTQITRMDKQVGNLLEQLEIDGLADDTIVFFYSDHGEGLPRGKRWLHDSGTRVPLIIRFPEKHRRLAPGKPGEAVDELVSFVDFAPTILSLAGLEIPACMQGRAFLGKAKGKPRPHVFAIRDRVDEVFELSRGVREERYHYIRNFMPHRARMQFSDYSERTPIRQELRRLAAAGKLEGDAKWLMSSTKPPEELYDTRSDPHELRNLAASEDHRPILRRMRKALREWMIETRDTGLLPESEMLERARGRSPYEMARAGGEFPVERILDVAERVGMGVEHRAELQSLLSDGDRAVRYWAAAGLAALGAEARPATDELRKALGDESPCVRFAAAEALCNAGHDPEALSVLGEGVLSADSRIRLQALATVIVLGEKGRTLAKTLERAKTVKCAPSTQAQYCKWATARALKNLESLR